MDCNRYIPKLQLAMGNYTVTNDFFVVDVTDANVVLGCQWLYYIGKYTTDQQDMEMEFNDPVDGRRVVLRAMHKYLPKLVSSNHMEAVLKRGGIEWAVECLITDNRQSEHPRPHSDDIQVLLRKHHKVFDDIPPSRPPNRSSEHVIELEEGVQTVITTLYQHSELKLLEDKQSWVGRTIILPSP